MTKEIFQQAALSYLHVPYLYGGASSLKGIDCSELVQDLLRMLGIDPAGDQSAQMLHDFFRVAGVHGKLGCGSLCFYGKGRGLTHVAMMLDETTVIEAGGGDSTTISIDAAVKRDAKVRLRPYNHRLDLQDVIQPPGLPWA